MLCPKIAGGSDKHAWGGRRLYEINCTSVSVLTGNPKLLLSLQTPMLYWALVCAIAALIFGLLGFTGLARGFATIARFLLAVFVILLLLILIFGGVSFHTGGVR
jgi:uncharacterized membrane protein YtjA (UPF0391 family)